jgi:hypothetical protein
MVGRKSALTSCPRDASCCYPRGGNAAGTWGETANERESAAVKRRRWTLRDYLSLSAAAVVLGFILYVAVLRPHGPFNWGFGPDWYCLNKGLCFRKQ